MTEVLEEGPQKKLSSDEALKDLRAYDTGSLVFRSYEGVLKAKGNPDLELAAQMAGVHRGARVVLEVFSGNQKRLIEDAMEYWASDDCGEFGAAYVERMEKIMELSSLVVLNSLKHYRVHAGSSSIAEYLTEELADERGRETRLPDLGIIRSW